MVHTPERMRISFETLLAPILDVMTPEVAQVLANVRYDQATNDRLDELAEKNRESQITPAELAEYDALVVAGNMFSVLQGKAIAYLRTRKAS